MMPESLEIRVLKLEEEMTTLRELPKKFDELGLQILQLRAELRDEFSAMRAEMREGDEETRRQMREADEETKRYMRMLHEDVISRLGLLQEGRDSPKRRRRKP